MLRELEDRELHDFVRKFRRGLAAWFLGKTQEDVKKMYGNLDWWGIDPNYEIRSMEILRQGLLDLSKKAGRTLDDSLLALFATKTAAEFCDFLQYGFEGRRA